MRQRMFDCMPEKYSSGSSDGRSQLVELADEMSLVCRDKQVNGVGFRRDFGMVLYPLRQ